MNIPEEAQQQVTQAIALAMAKSDILRHDGHWDEAVQVLARAALSAAAPYLMAMALREAADEVDNYAWQPGDGHTLPESEQAAYMLGANDAHHVAEKLIRSRAKNIKEQS